MKPHTDAADNLKSGDLQGGGAPLSGSKMETYGNLVDADIS